MKTKIYKFNPVIYPFPLLVCKYVGKETENELKDLFYVQSDGYTVREADDDFFITPTTAARSIQVVSKNGEDLCFLVVLYRPELVGIGLLAHEAHHIAAMTARQLGFGDGTPSNDEPMAYLAQWVATCTESVLKGKPGLQRGELFG